MLKELSIDQPDGSCLFTDRGKLWSDEFARNAFRRVCRDHGLHAGIQDFRQVYTALFRKFGPASSSSRLLQVVHEQAGHSFQTADIVYGITNSDPLELGPDTLASFFEASSAWHDMIGFGTAIQPSASFPALKKGSSSTRRRSNHDELEHLSNACTRLETKMIDLTTVVTQIESSLSSISTKLLLQSNGELYFPLQAFLTRS